jgi:ATPase subunit of ABC transporter with duplicated ATPase domains
MRNLFESSRHATAGTGFLRRNVLLLDEPTDDLDVETGLVLEQTLEDLAGCAVTISHDRRATSRTTKKDKTRGPGRSLSSRIASSARN